ncbi:MAG: HesA/MoeB/ThiF family protein [Planctomycetota bacterium]
MPLEPSAGIEVGGEGRHDRTRRFFGEGRLERLARSRVLIVGAGAIGNEVAKNLALVGVGHLTVVDFDTVEASNLNRCIFFRERDVGRKKVRVLRRALKAAAPGVEVRTHARPVQEAPDRAWDADAVALCVDDEFARYYVNARLLGGGREVPVVNGAMGRTWCEVTVLVPGRTACLVCLWSEAYLQQVVGEEVREECDQFFQRTRERFPAISVLTSVVGGVTSTEVVKLLAGPSDEMVPALGQRIRYDIGQHRFSVHDIVPNPRCVDAVCRKRRDA